MAFHLLRSIRSLLYQFQLVLPGDNSDQYLKNLNITFGVPIDGWQWPSGVDRTDNCEWCSETHNIVVSEQNSVRRCTNSHVASIGTLMLFLVMWTLVCKLLFSLCAVRIWLTYRKLWRIELSYLDFEASVAKCTALQCFFKELLYMFGARKSLYRSGAKGSL